MSPSNKAIALSSSGRKYSNSSYLLSQAVQSAEDAGIGLTTYDLTEIDIADCTACDACRKTGVCIIDDTATKILDEIWEAGRVILAMPLYYFGPPSRLKALIDRAQYLYHRKYTLKQKLDDAAMNKRKGAAIITAGSNVENLFDGADMTLRYFFDSLQIDFSSKLYRTGLDEAGSAAHNSQLIEEAKALGRSLKV